MRFRNSGNYFRLILCYRRAHTLNALPSKGFEPPRQIGSRAPLPPSCRSQDFPRLPTVQSSSAPTSPNPGAAPRRESEVCFGHRTCPARAMWRRPPRPSKRGRSRAPEGKLAHTLTAAPQLTLLSESLFVIKTRDERTLAAHPVSPRHRPLEP